jgi:DNA-binding transcriptional ArsR family regulator
MIEADEYLAHLVTALKALAEPNRLRAVAAIAERPRTGTELCELLDLGPPTVSHHMARLESAGIVRVTREGQRRRYSLDRGVMRQLASSRLDDPPETGTDPADERLAGIPRRRKKRVAVLQRLVEQFEPGRDYSEREVNAVLVHAHADVATLRRELIGYGFMTRVGSTYRVATELPERGANAAQEAPPDADAWLAALIDTAARG